MLQSSLNIWKKLLENIILILKTSKSGNIKVITCNKNKQVRKITSAEKGILITILAAVNALVDVYGVS